jgi:hypothetical protein
MIGRRICLWAAGGHNTTGMALVRMAQKGLSTCRLPRCIAVPCSKWPQRQWKPDSGSFGQTCKNILWKHNLCDPKVKWGLFPGLKCRVPKCSVYKCRHAIGAYPFFSVTYRSSVLKQKMSPKIGIWESSKKSTCFTAFLIVKYNNFYLFFEKVFFADKWHIGKYNPVLTCVF